MGDEGFEFATQRITLDPVEHVTAETGSGGDSVISIDVGDVLLDVLPGFDEVIIRRTA